MTKWHFQFSSSTQGTVWKFHDFSIPQILCQINFEDPRSAKTAIFANLGAVNFVDLINFSLQKVQKFTKMKIQSLKMC